MIEDIQALRQAARLTPDNENQDEKVWCIAAGNVNLIDDIAYKAIASKHSVKILFREHVILKDKRLILSCYMVIQGKLINLKDFVIREVGLLYK